MSFGPTELIIVLLIVLLLFGGAKLPKLARSLGEASKEFKKGVEDKDKEESKDDGKTAVLSSSPTERLRWGSAGAGDGECGAVRARRLHPRPRARSGT